jgi:predicted DNA-binding protein
MEQQPQAQPAEGEQGQRFKTLGIRIEEELHTQLTFIAQLSGSTIADQIRQSIEARVQAAQEDPELIARAEEVRAEIEREAEARKQAISGLFGKAAMSSEVTPPRAGGGRSRQSREDSSAS